MIFKSVKKDVQRLKASFGKIKDAYFDFEAIDKYFRNKENSESLQILSDKTCNDLDFEELFAYLDRTTSRVGQQYLYNRLRVIPHNTEFHNTRNENIIEKLTNDVDVRISVQRKLERLQTYKAYHIISLFQEEHPKPPRWFFMVKLLSLISLISSVLFFFNPQFIFAVIILFIVNLGIHFWNKRNLLPYVGSIPQLLLLNAIATDLFKTDCFKGIDPALSKSIKIISQVSNRMRFFQMESKLQGDLAVIFWGFFELVKILFLLEPILLYGVLKRLDSKRMEIEAVFEFVGHIDTLISIASLRAGLDFYCIPTISNFDHKISGRQIYHPLIPNFIKNDIEVTDKSILLTGSNMSGKTSFIRTIGLNTITAQSINTCFAVSFSAPSIRIFSAIRISDDLLQDKSYYFEEVLTIKEMIDESDAGVANLFLLDEIFKGTNTVERIAAGKAVLSKISKNNNIVFVSTHDIELTDLLSEEYELYHFSEMISDKNVDFDYKLKKGKLKNRNAIKILQVNDYPDDVIREAISLSEKFDTLRDTWENDID